MSTPTMKQIAALAGVSTATVSLALRNDTRITTEVRAKVRQVAEELGYRPNPLLSIHMAHLRTSMAQSWHATLGFLTQAPPQQWKNSPHMAMNLIYSGARERAAALGFNLDVFWLTAPGMNAARMSRILSCRGIPGLVIPPAENLETSKEEYIGIEWPQFAASTISYSLTEPNLHRACHDAFTTMGKALTELETRGYRRIGFVSASNDDVRVDHIWVGRYLIYQATVAESDRVPTLVTKNWEQANFTRWLKETKPDAIITTRPKAVAAWLQSAHFRMPEDIGLLTVRWRHDFPQCSGFYHNFDLLGATAVDLVAVQLQHNERGLPAVPRVTLLPSVWKEGTTLRPLLRPQSPAPVEITGLDAAVVQGAVQGTAPATRR